MSTLGQRIRKRRIELNMTQEELCKKVGYKSRTTVNKVELGCNAINQKRIVAFAQALDTTPAYLMGWEEKNLPQDNLSEGEKMLLDLFNKVPEEKQKLVIEMIRVALESL